MSPAVTSLTGGASREILRRLELAVTRRLDGLLHGDHRGLVPGHGSEAGEARRYGPGDDVRQIDWNVTARMGEPYLRETIADRELETWIVLDRSPRLDFGTADCEKRDLALAAAAAVGFLTNRDGNRVGALLAEPNGSFPLVIPARGSRKHLLHILHTIADSPRQTEPSISDLQSLLHHVNHLAPRRGLIAVISDFRVAPGWESAFGALALGHEVLAVELRDPAESILPNVGMLPITDPGTGATRELATHKKSVRLAYAEAAQAHFSHIAHTCRSHGIDHLVLSTDRPWLDDVVGFVAQRRLRIAASTGGRR